MKPSDAKKRRLAALNQHHSAAVAPSNVQSKRQQQHSRQQRSWPAAAVPVCPPATTAAPAPAATATVTTTATATAVAAHQQHQSAAILSENQATAFPYSSMSSLTIPSASALASRLQLPPARSCQGNVNDMLEQLMVPNMPPPTARTMITTRTTDKSVLLDNPTAKLNITRPNRSSKSRRQNLAASLLSREKRLQLSQLPASGLDYAALLQLHELWIKYVTGVLSGKPDPPGQLLSGLDWHGAVLRVTACKDPRLNGCAGIVAKARANSMLLVGPDGCTHTVPYKGTTFEVSLPPSNQTLVMSGGSLSSLQCRLAPGDGFGNGG